MEIEKRSLIEGISRRQFIQMSTMLGTAGLLSHSLSSLAAGIVNLPFANGKRSMASFPQKGNLILLRTRPPLLETPFEVFDKGIFTPNNLFFVRWHLADIPTSVDVESFRLKVHGHVKKPIELTLKQLVHDFQPVQMAAVNQCSGNSRGFFQPRVSGAEWGNGAMGNALWTGVRLKDVLKKSGINPGAVQVRFNGLDKGVVPGTPDYMKSLDVDHALDDEVIIAYAMNGKPLPLLNGFPLRLIVPGWYSTYWVKMLSDIEVLNKPDENYWMTSAYLMPATPGASVAPGQKDYKKIPINKMVPRSFITNFKDGDMIHAERDMAVRGIAFGGDAGVKQVLFSADRGKTWKPATLGKDYGKYSFRQWETHFRAGPRGADQVLMVKTINSHGLEQPGRPTWNPTGYMLNVIEKTILHSV
ncbi:molybdopterin-dependent oxidoreductase [Thermithiobacillus plumbiphilus]|uniref:Molybdopterin-dependent oxidoreductase n=1 Tax=Thermithiobacillus plumbiphilus TaxID=1729899 RepID=A0ABU9DB61_9PROT